MRPNPTDNSCINMVLERRTGIPITLSLVYMEVSGCWGVVSIYAGERVLGGR